MVLFLLKLILELLTDKLLKLLFELGGLVIEIVLETLFENIFLPSALVIQKSFSPALANDKIEDFDINIINLDTNSKTKNILFEITNKRLLEKTGGVVQGMSGSPIIQNNKIIGAVNYVIVNDTSKGYGIFITTMLEEGDK